MRYITQMAMRAPCKYLVAGFFAVSIFLFVFAVFQSGPLHHIYWQSLFPRGEEGHFAMSDCNEYLWKSSLYLTRVHHSPINRLSFRCSQRCMSSSCLRSFVVQKRTYSSDLSSFWVSTTLDEETEDNGTYFCLTADHTRDTIFSMDTS